MIFHPQDNLLHGKPVTFAGLDWTFFRYILDTNLKLLGWFCGKNEGQWEKKSDYEDLWIVHGQGCECARVWEGARDERRRMKAEFTRQRECVKNEWVTTCASRVSAKVMRWKIINHTTIFTLEANWRDNFINSEQNGPCSSEKTLKQVIHISMELRISLARSEHRNVMTFFCIGMRKCILRSKF